MAYQSKKYRKFVATAATATLVATAVAPAAGFAAEKDFTDTIPSWAEKAVDYLVGKGALEGYPDGTFKQAAPIKRGEAAKILALTLDLKVDDEAKTNFADAKDHWASKYIAAIQAQKPGVIDGDTSGKFRPNDTITRQEMAKMVVEAYGLELDESAVLDFTDNNGWGKEYVNILASLGVVEGVSAGKFAPGADVTRGQASVFVHRTEVPSERVPVETTEAKVVSVSAINGGQILVKFSADVDTTTAEDETNYTLSDGKTVADATVQADGKSVLLTLTSAYDNKAAYKVAVTVQDVVIDGTVDTKFPVFTQVITVEDKVKAEIASATAVTKEDVTRSVTVKFSEPVQSGAAYKINGVSVSNAVLNGAGTEITLTAASDLEVGKTHKIEAVNLTDKSGNVNAVVSKDFTVTKDAVAPVVESVVAYGDNALLVTFNKDMKNDAAALSNLQSNIKVKNDVYSDVTVTGVTQLDGDSKRQFVVQLSKTGTAGVDADELFTSTKTSHNLTVLFVDNTIEDYLGNKLVGISKTTTITKDTVAPEVTGISYKKNSAGKVTALVVNFSEGVKANGALAFPTTIVNENGVVVTSASVFGTIGTANVAEGAKKATFNITSGTEKEVTGKYSVSLAAGYVKDASLAGNDSKAYQTVLDFGASQTVGEYDVTSATNGGTNVVTVVFPEAVKGGAVAGSATDASRYTINGAALPSGTTITLNAEDTPNLGDKAQTIATITLPAETISATDTSAIFTVNGVQTLTGKTNKPYTTTLTVTDNVKPELKSAKVLDNKTIELTYSEAITTLNNANVGDEFVIYQGTTALALAEAELTASSVSGFPTKVRITVAQGSDTPGTPASTFGSATALTADAGNSAGTGTPTVTGTFNGTSNETLTVEKTSSGWSVDGGVNDVTLTGTTFTYKGLTVETAGATVVATGDKFTVALTAAVSGTSATTLDLTKALSVETKVPATNVDVLDRATNKQVANIKVDVAK